MAYAPQKVLVICRDNPYSSIGGIQSHIKSLASILQAKLHLEVGVISTKGAPLFGIPRILFLFNPKHKPDLVHIHGYANIWQAFVIFASTLFGWNTIWTPHYHPAKHTSKPLAAAAYFAVLTFILSCIRKKYLSVLCLSLEELAIFQDIKLNAFYFPFGAWYIGYQNYALNPQSPPPLAVYKLWTSRHYFMSYVGRLSYNKGINEFISLVHSYPQHTFLLAGPFDQDLLLAFLESDIPPNLETIWFPDDLKVIEIFRNSMYSYMGSLYEAFGQTVIEAHIQGALAPIRSVESYPAFLNWPSWQDVYYLNSFPILSPDEFATNFTRQHFSLLSLASNLDFRKFFCSQ